MANIASLSTLLVIPTAYLWSKFWALKHLGNAKTRTRIVKVAS